jgi:hypothetical protein
MLTFLFQMLHCTQPRVAIQINFLLLRPGHRSSVIAILLQQVSEGILNSYQLMLFLLSNFLMNTLTAWVKTQMDFTEIAVSAGSRQRYVKELHRTHTALFLILLLILHPSVFTFMQQETFMLQHRLVTLTLLPQTTIFI